MNVTFICPHCDRPTRQPFTTAIPEVACGHCQSITRFIETAGTGPATEKCMLCARGELFVRKDFSQRLGLTIIAIGFIAATITWAWHMPLATYAILGVSAAIDFTLFFVVGNLLECYNCHAEFRGMEHLGEFQAFNLETHERFRQQSARLREATENPGGT
jgi:hypothetical protein